LSQLAGLRAVRSATSALARRACRARNAARRLVARLTPIAGFALDVTGGALLLLGFHIANEIVRRASVPAHGESS
jgi:hypothetical protein